MNTNLPDANEFRQRIMREDDLLNTRTTVFLVTNGLLMTAVGISKEPALQLLISLLGILLTLCWLLCSWQNWKVIKCLTVEYRKHHTQDYIEKIVQAAMYKPGWKRPTDLIAKPLPGIFLLAWCLVIMIRILSFG